MRFEEYLKQLEEAKEEAVVSSEEASETIEEEISEPVTEKVIDSADMCNEILPLIPMDKEDVYRTLQMYKEIDPEFANSALVWD
jgi:hypothetical protein